MHVILRRLAAKSENHWGFPDGRSCKDRSPWQRKQCAWVGSYLCKPYGHDKLSDQIKCL